jgi:hypothetical protein
MQYYHTGTDGCAVFLPSGKGLCSQDLYNPAPAVLGRLNIGDEIEIELTGHLSIRSLTAAHHMS